jgi:hypothetical protein
MVGDRIGLDGYKNGKLVFDAVGKLVDRKRFTVVCVGGAPLIEREYRMAARGADTVRCTLGDEELRAAYAGAHAFLYPSRYEGFGLPVVEAMASGAPVVTCRNSSLVEVAGEAAMFVGEDDPDGMVSAIERLCDPKVRDDLIGRGTVQARKFNFRTMARRVADALTETHVRLSDGQLPRPSPLWQDFRQVQQSSQAPLNYQFILRQAVRGAASRALRTIGIDPATSRTWAAFRALQHAVRRLV